MNLEPTYGTKLNNGLIRLIEEEQRSGRLPAPMFRLRRRYLQAKGISWKNLSKHEKEAMRWRFTNAINNLEGSFITTHHEPNGCGIPTRIITYLENPHALNGHS